ncbi:lysophospholipid acyltransferase family protein [Anatilimnocola floriformis]|uniref:lysophospholipid acyltransferase family protein n=1 Tax=Anatilimnocola floriformis TaxID=2948575 RepID=UPI0020C4C7F5|nr:1-acyl-sn-glycerol-3-phosphate acyltransferase [Anatilimnocola floriformis]
MQKIIVERPYQFVPAYHNPLFPSLLQAIRWPDMLLRWTEGVDDSEVRGVELLKESMATGHAVLLTPNHPRTADPVALGLLSRAAGCHLYAMASWHLFQHGWVKTQIIRLMGAFSVNREGVDRQAINVAVDLLAAGKRPLVIFPEGATSRTADYLHALLDGVAFIARAAAKKRSKTEPAGKVVVHPIGMKYLYRGNLAKTADEVLTSIEHRLSWQPQRQLDLLSRVAKVGMGLLSLKEIEYFGQTQTGTLAERLQKLIDRLLKPLEERWLGAAQEGTTVPRVRTLRTKILPDMVAGKIDAAEKQRRWRDLADLYLAQQLSSYPPEYLTTRLSVDRVLETIEKFEEDLTDRCRVHGKLKVIMQVAPAIEVSPERDRKAPIDPLMLQIQQSLQGMMDKLSLESPLVDEQTAAAIFPPVEKNG